MLLTGAGSTVTWEVLASRLITCLIDLGDLLAYSFSLFNSSKHQVSKVDLVIFELSKESYR